MKLVKVLLSIFILSIPGWCELNDGVTSDCLRLERGFHDLKEIVIHVSDHDENEWLKSVVAQEIFTIFQKSEDSCRPANYASGPGLLSVALAKENSQYIVNMVLLSGIHSEWGLLFVDCFCVNESVLIEKIQEKVSVLACDLASGGSYPMAFISE